MSIHFVIFSVGKQPVGWFRTCSGSQLEGDWLSYSGPTVTLFRTLKFSSLKLQYTVQRDCSALAAEVSSRATSWSTISCWLGPWSKIHRAPKLHSVPAGDSALVAPLPSLYSIYILQAGAAMGAILSIGWSSGRLQQLPLVFGGPDTEGELWSQQSDPTSNLFSVN